jgi:hypothetical protein
MRCQCAVSVLLTEARNARERSAFVTIPAPFVWKESRALVFSAAALGRSGSVDSERQRHTEKHHCDDLPRCVAEPHDSSGVDKC